LVLGGLSVVSHFPFVVWGVSPVWIIFLDLCNRANMVLEDRFSSVPNIAQIGGDIICYFKAAQGVYVPE
jgi:hypothetical protein